MTVFPAYSTHSHGHHRRQDRAQHSEEAWEGAGDLSHILGSRGSCGGPDVHSLSLELQGQGWRFPRGWCLFVAL